MNGFKRCAAVVLLMGAALANAEHKPAYQAMGGLNVKFAEDVTVKLRGGLNLENQLEQYDDYPTINYAKKGLTAKDGSVGIEVKIGKLGNLDITGGGEVLVLSRTLDDTTTEKNYLEVRPTGLLNLTFPFARIFKAQYLSRFERRLFREPGDPKSHFRYNSHTRLASEGFLPLQTGFFLFYEGSVQKLSTSMSRWGGGLTMEPVKNLLIEGSYSMLWKPENIHSNIFPVSLGISYTLDFAK